MVQGLDEVLNIREFEDGQPSMLVTPELVVDVAREPLRVETGACAS